MSAPKLKHTAPTKEKKPAGKLVEAQAHIPPEGYITWEEGDLPIIAGEDHAYNAVCKDDMQIATTVMWTTKLQSIKERLLKYGLRCITGPNVKYVQNFDRHHKEHMRETFDFANDEESFRHMYSSFLKKLSGLASHLDSIFVDSTTIQMLFPLPILKMYIERLYNRPGYWLYDEVQRSKFVFMSLLMTHHLLSDTKYHLKVDTQAIKMMDPVLRGVIRRQNREDPLLRQKYLDSGLRLKDFVKDLLATYFLNQNFRYISSNGFTHEHVLKLIRVALELGFYEADEILSLLRTISLRIHCLFLAETALLGELAAGAAISFYYPDLYSYARFFWRCRQETLKIVLQCVTLINDDALEQSVNHLTQNKRKLSFDGCFEQAFFNNTELSNYVYAIVTKLMPQKLVQDYLSTYFETHTELVKILKDETREYTKLFEEVFMLIISKDRDSMTSSFGLIDDAVIDFHLRPRPKSITDEYLPLAKKLRTMFIQVFEDLKVVTLSDSTKVKVIIEQLLVGLKILEEKKDSLTAELQELKMFSISLASQNVEMIMLYIATILDGYTTLVDKSLEDYVTNALYLIVFLISKTATTATNQSLLFGELGWKLITRLLETRPLLIIASIERIFTKRREIFNNEPDIFGKLVSVFRKLLSEVEDLVDDLKAELSSSGLVSVDPKLAADAMGHLSEPVAGKILDNMVKSMSRSEQPPEEPLQMQKAVSSSPEEPGISKLTLKEKMNKLVALHIYCRCLSGLVPHFDNGVKYSTNYDLNLLHVIEPLFVKIIMPKLILEPEIRQIGLKRLDMGFLRFHKVNDVLKFTTSDKIVTKEEVAAVMYEFGLSFLHLFNSCTSRIYYGTTAMKICTLISPADLGSSFGSLENSVRGINLRQQLVQLISNFYVFQRNHTISKRGGAGNSDFLSDLLNYYQIYMKAEIEPQTVRLLVECEFRFIRNWARKHLSSNDQIAKEHAEQYVFKGLFPLVFKYARGLMATVTTPSQDYQNSFDYIKECLDVVSHFYELLETFIHDARENYGLTLSLSMLDALTRSVTKGAHTLDGASPQRAISSFIPEVMPTVAPASLNDPDGAGGEADMSEAKVLLGKITQAPAPEATTPSSSRKPPSEKQSDLEPDELVCPELAVLRSTIRALCRTIETNYPKPLLRYIESFDRLNALKRKKSKLDELFLKKAEHSSSKKYDQEYRRQRRADIEVALGTRSDGLLQQFKAVCEVYELKKSEWVELDTKQNSFYSFLDKRPSTTQDLANYIFNTLDNILRIVPDTVVSSGSSIPLEGFGCFLCRKMFTTKIPLSLVSFLSFMFRRVSSFRTYLFKEIEKDDFVNPTAEVFAKIFWTLMQMVRFLYGKTFHGETYLEFKKIFEELCITLFSFVEQNRKPIKRLVASHTFVFRLKSSLEADDGTVEYDLLMQFYTALARTFHISEVVNLSKTTSLTMVEMPENIFVVQALVHLVREICSGPYLPAQDQLYRFDHDKWTAVAFRSLEDVDSNFYNMQMDMLQYCATLTEGISKDQETQEDDKEVYSDLLTGARISAKLAKAKMVSLLTASFREDLIAKMIVKSIKKLFIYTLIKTQPPGFKAKPIEKLKQDLQKKKAAKEREQKEFELKSKEIQSKFRKGVDFYRTRQSDKHIMEAEIKKIEQKLHKVDTAPTLESVFESYDSLVYEELEDIIKITDYRQILDFYVRYPVFSEHSLLKIALKLYTITHNFSQFSENFQLRIRERSRMLYAYFGQEVPLILIDDIDLSDIDPLNSKNAPEDINVFMFLAKISMQVEVNIPSSVGLNLQMISFQIHPMSFELTHNTKMNFLNKADSGNIVQEFLQNYRYFEIEMRHNLDRRQKHPLKYFFGKKEHQTVMRYSLWVAGLIMNVLLLLDARRDSTGNIKHLFLSDGFFNAVGALIGIFALILFLIYMMSRYKEIVEIYTIKRRAIHGAKLYRFYDFYYIYFKMPFLHKGTPLQLFFHMLLAVLGPTTSFFFHTIHPLLVIFLSNTSFKVLQSITTYPRQLLTTLLLGVFAITSFAYLVFEFYNKDWDSLVDNDGTIEMCKDMWECIFYSVNLGFRSGLGNQFGTPISHGQTGYFFGRLIFSVTFNILINIIWINIFSGIIIDTFADKRDEEDRKKQFLMDNCLICMQSRETIEKRESSFHNHIELKHDLWKYVHYMIFLSRKDPNTFSAVENSIYHTIMEDSTDWIPTNKITERIDFKLDKIIQGVSQAVGTLTTNLQNLSEKVEDYNIILRDATETDKEKAERLSEELKQKEERKLKELAKIELREKQLKDRNRFMDVYREEIEAGKKSKAKSDKKPVADPTIEKQITERSDKPERTASLKPSEKADDSDKDGDSSSS